MGAGVGGGGFGDLKVDPFRSTVISAFVKRGYLTSLQGVYPRCGTRGGEGGERGEWYVRDAHDTEGSKVAQRGASRSTPRHIDVRFSHAVGIAP